MSVRSTEEIIKKAKQMDMERLAHPVTQAPELSRRLDVIEAKIELVMQKLAMTPNNGLADIHQKLLGELADWKSASGLAGVLGYSHEHVTRRIAELKRAGYLEERRSGKTILYKKVAQ